MAAALSLRTTTTLVLALAAVLVSLSLRGADAVRLTPGDSPIVATCMTGPHPDLCVDELGQRLLDIQTAIASASSSSQAAAKIAGAPGQVDAKALVSVAMEAASEAGTVLVSIFEGKFPGFNTGVPDFKKCLGNCTVTIKSAMKKLHGAKVAVNLGDKQVGKTLAMRAVADVSSCTISCRELNGDVKLIVTQSLTEFTKMLQIAVGFMNKMPKTPPSSKTPPPPPSESEPPLTPPARTRP